MELEKLLKQAAIMENKPGGMFCIRMRSLMSSPGDGQTLIYFYNGLASVQAVRQRFDINRQLIPQRRLAMFAPGKSHHQ